MGESDDGADNGVDDEPRLAPLTPDELTGDQLALLAATGGPDSLNIFRTLVRHPGLYRRWAPFGGKLLRGGKLADRERELVILRAAWRCGSGYEWGQHVAIARQAGLADDEIAAVAAPEGGHRWDEGDATLLVAVDELIADHRLGPDSWAALRPHHDDEQLVELTLLAGHYAMIAGALNSFATPLDPGHDLPPLGQVSP